MRDRLARLAARRAGQRSTVHSRHGRPRRGLDRRARRHARQAGHRRGGARARAAADAERGFAPREHRAGGGVRRAGGTPGGRAARAREHAVSRVGAGQSRGAVALDGRALGRARNGASRARAVARSDGDPVRAARLLRGPSARLHGRLGSSLRGDHARRAGLALPSGALDHRASQFENVRVAAAGGHLARFAGLSCLSRRGLDARPVPFLPGAGNRLRRLPLPGVRAGRRCGGDGPRLRAGAAARHRGGRAVARRAAVRRKPDTTPPIRLRRFQNA